LQNGIEIDYSNKYNWRKKLQTWRRREVFELKWRTGEWRRRHGQQRPIGVRKNILNVKKFRFLRSTNFKLFK
jgi:hypothetical protein